MAPTLRDGQWILVERDYYRTHQPRRGEVVVFRHEGVDYVKRVVGIGGDELLMLANFTPGDCDLMQPVCHRDESRMRALSRLTSVVRLYRLRVPDDSFYALGDALTRSRDSREIGPVAEAELVGRVHPRFCRPWPYELVLPPRPKPARGREHVAFLPTRLRTARACYATERVFFTER
jgi:signal peptidase I